MFNEITWKTGEDLVASFMKEKGYKIVYRNYRCKIAEIDIVAILSKKVQKHKIIDEFKQKIKQKSKKSEIKFLKMNLKTQIKNLKDLIVITEVKARANQKFGTGIDAISQNKIVHMKRGAEMLLKMKEFENMQPRFDVASVDGGEINYIEGAF